MTPEKLIEELKRMETVAGHNACSDKFDIAMYHTGYAAGLRQAIRVVRRALPAKEVRRG